MNKQTAHDEWLKAQGQLKAAERDAGIEKGLEELNERNAFIASPEKHLNDYRAMVFSVADVELRRRVIHYSRECHRLCRVTALEDLRALQKRCKSGGEQFRRNAFWSAAVGGALSILVSNYYWGLPGALIGTFLFTLVGVDGLLRAERLAAVDIEGAKEEISEQQAFLQELGDEGGDFTETEEVTGQPDAA